MALKLDQTLHTSKKSVLLFSEQMFLTTSVDSVWKDQHFKDSKDVSFSFCLTGCWAQCCSSVGPSVCCVCPPLWFMETYSWMTVQRPYVALRRRTYPTLVSNTVQSDSYYHHYTCHLTHHSRAEKITS